MSIPMRLLGYPKDSLYLLLEGQHLAKSVGDNRHLSRLYSVIGHRYAMTGNPAEAIRYSENSLSEARKIDDIHLIAPIACDLSTVFLVWPIRHWAGGNIWRVRKTALSSILTKACACS